MWSTKLIVLTTGGEKFRAAMEGGFIEQYELYFEELISVHIPSSIILGPDVSQKSVF